MADAGRQAPAGTIAERLRSRLESDPTRVVLHLVSASGESLAVTTRELLERSAAFQHAFAQRDVVDRVLGVCLYHSLDLYAAFIGALWAGAIPTMLPPPSPRIEPAKYQRSFQHILMFVAPALMVVDASTRAALQSATGTSDFVDLLLDPALVKPAAILPVHPRGMDDVILVQHSSGTTGLQKGVALSSRAVAAHNAAYGSAIGLAADDVIVSWLPLYHDMGFIACFLMPLMEGVTVVAMSPFDWVQRPAMLLEAAHHFRATLSWLPNFAFAYLAKAVRPSALAPGTDLSSVRAWINSSEPVTAAALQAFQQRFAANGVRNESLGASYAMAENVYAVTQTRPGGLRTLVVDRAVFRDAHRAQPPATNAAGVSFVSNGTAVSGTEVRVLDAADRALPEGHVGELALRGDYLFSGYLKRQDLTDAAMTRDGWYRSGDLGFMQDGEVFVTGRRKDLVIIQGRNFYPTDIEAAVATVDGVIEGRVAAFGLSDERTGTERLIVVAECEEARLLDAGIAANIRALIAQEFDCTPSDVRLVPPRWLVKSTSGKVARPDNRQKYIDAFATTEAGTA